MIKAEHLRTPKIWLVVLGILILWFFFGLQ